MSDRLLPSSCWRQVVAADAGKAHQRIRLMHFQACSLVRQTSEKSQGPFEAMSRSVYTLFRPRSRGSLRPSSARTSLHMVQVQPRFHPRANQSAVLKRSLRE